MGTKSILYGITSLSSLLMSLYIKNKLLIMCVPVLLITVGSYSLEYILPNYSGYKYVYSVDFFNMKDTSEAIIMLGLITIVIVGIITMLIIRRMRRLLLDNFLKYIRYNIYSIQYKVFSTRTITTIVLMLLCNIVFSVPILNFASDTGYKVNVMTLPFFLCNLSYMCAFVPIAIYYFSQVPFLNYSEMYCVIREGKTKWALKHILHIVFMSYIFMFLLEVTSIIPYIFRGDFSNEWGEVITTLSITNRWMDYGTSEILYTILEHYSPYKSMAIIFLFVGLVICFLGVFMFSMSLLFTRLIAMCSGMIFEVLMITAFNMRTIDNYLIYLSPFSWTDLSIFGRKYDGMEYFNGTPTMGWCVGILLLLIVVLTIISIVRVNHMNFNFTSEE